MALPFCIQQEAWPVSEIRPSASGSMMAHACMVLGYWHVSMPRQVCLPPWCVADHVCLATHRHHTWPPPYPQHTYGLKQVQASQVHACAEMTVGVTTHEPIGNYGTKMRFHARPCTSGYRRPLTAWLSSKMHLSSSTVPADAMAPP
jgi:hypothetical protein